MSESASSDSSLPREVIELVQLQNFDGSFSLSHALGEIVGESTLQMPANIQIEDTVWATAIAVAFLQKHLVHAGQSDVLYGILDKVWEFVENKLSRVKFESLVELVTALMCDPQVV
jgi:hypothetical protein